MSVANVTTGHTGPGAHWEPALTPREALKVSISRREYESAVLYARTAAEYHQGIGTPRDHWEPAANLNDKLAAPFIANGEQELAGRLESEADPQLDKSQSLAGNVKAGLDQIAEAARPISTPESGTTYSVPEAVDCVRQCNEVIERDEAAGMAPQPSHQCGAQAAGDVGSVGGGDWVPHLPHLLPQCSPAAAMAGLARLVVRRDCRGGHHRWPDLAGAPRAPGTTTMRGRLVPTATARRRTPGSPGATGTSWLTALPSVAITGGMIWRGVAALGDASLGTTAVMIFVAAITGLLLPTLAYLGLPWTAPRISREATASWPSWTMISTTTSTRSATAAGISPTPPRSAIRSGTRRSRTSATRPRRRSTSVYEFYGTVRLLIGGLRRPAGQDQHDQHDPAGNHQRIHRDQHPGRGTVNLDPLLHPRPAWTDRGPAADLFTRIERISRRTRGATPAPDRAQAGVC